MRKILYWLFLFCIIWVSQSFATVIYSNTWSVSLNWTNQSLNIPAISPWTIDTFTLSFNMELKEAWPIFVQTSYPWDEFKLYDTFVSTTLWSYTFPSAIPKNDWFHSYFITASPTRIAIYRDDILFYQSSFWYNNNAWGAFFWYEYPVATYTQMNLNSIYYNNTLLDEPTQLECTTETIPDTDIINIQPTSTWAIAEYVENPTDKEYWYSTSLSGENPLLVTLLNANDVLWWDEFSYQTWSVSFKTPFTQNTFFALSSSANIEYFKMLWGFGNVDIYTYKEDAKTIRNIYENVNLNDWEEGFGFPVWWTPLVVIQFKYSLFTKEIDTLEVYSIWANTTKEVEICMDPETDQYYIDWEEYIWNPYVDLVWDPEPTEVSFTSSWYLFFDNWFCLSDFLPFPSGGDLLFDIKNPLGKIVTTYPIKNTWLYKYWIGTCSKITTNYHEQAWQYYVKWRYIYKWVSYDIHPNFFAYTITKPESIPSDINPWLDDWPTACGVSDEDAWFLPWVSRFFACISETISSFFKNQYEAVKKIWSLIHEISDIFTTEVENPFSFIIPKASASEPLSWVMTVFDRPEGFAETPFWKIEKLMWGAFAIVSLIVVLSLIIMIKGD